MSMFSLRDRQLVEFVSYRTFDGVEYPLFGGNRALLEFEDLGLPPINYLTDRGVAQDGERVRDYRLEKRTVGFRLYERGCTREDYWCSVGDMIEAVRPNRGESRSEGGTLIIVPPDGRTYTIGARYILPTAVGSWSGDSSTLYSDMDEVLTFECHDPIWTEGTPVAIETSPIPTDSCMPVCMPICMGGSSINEEIDFVYCGTWNGDTFVIEYIGPQQQPTVTSLTTGLSIGLNYNVAMNETVTITRTSDDVTVVSSTGQDLQGTITQQSSLINFFLATRSVLAADGTNTLQFTAQGGIAGTTGIIFTYVVRHMSPFVPCIPCP